MPKTLAEVAPNAWAYAEHIRSSTVPRDLLAQIAEFSAKSEQADLMIAEIALQASGETYAPLIAGILHGGSEGFQKKIRDKTLRFHLTQEQVDVLSAIIDVVKHAQAPRNDFAHHMYCRSPDLPDALLLLNPKLWLDHVASNFTRYESLPGGTFLALPLPSGRIPKPLNESIVVWTPRDISEAMSALITAAGMLEAFRFALMPLGRPDIFGALVNEPLLQERLRSVRNQRIPKPSRKPRAQEPRA